MGKGVVANKVGDAFLIATEELSNWLEKEQNTQKMN